MHRFLLTLTLLLLGSLPVSAQYTYHTLNLPAPEGGTLQLLDLTNDDHLLANGRLNGRRVDPARALHLISCLPGLLERSPTAVRQGPEVVSMNNSRTVVGWDEGVLGTFALRQTAAGDCAFFRVPGSVHTLLTAIADDGVSAGWYTNPIEVEPGLSRFHGFVQAADGTITTLTGWQPGDILFPDGINLAGDMVGHANLNVQPDNSYEYSAFYRKADGTMTALNDPTGQDLWCPAGLNNVGQTACITAQQQGVVGGAAWLVDLTTTPPTFTALNLPTPTSTAVAPRGINDQGWLVGLYREQLGPPCGPPSACTTFHQFLAVPTPPPPAPPTPPGRKKTQRFKHRTRVHAHDWQDEQRELSDTRWRPVWKDGRPCLTNGGLVVGEVAYGATR